MKATIYNDTPREISWTDEDSVTPELVKKIEDAGIELKIDWTKNHFYPAVLLLLENLGADEIEERLYDEDPDLIDLIGLAIQNPLSDPENSFDEFVRLYIPVILIILHKLTSD